MKNESETSIAIRQFIQSDKTSNSLSLARLLRKKWPTVFTSDEHARKRVRYYRGANGKYSRDCAKIEKILTPVMPRGRVNDYSPFVVNGKHTVGILSDIHAPYHDAGALEVAINHLKKAKCDVILLNGDTVDFHTLSRFDKEPDAAKFATERDTVIKLLAYLRHKFPKARIIWKDGNHDERFIKFVMNRAPELFDEQLFSFENLFKFGKFGINYVSDKRRIMLGKLTVLHGHEVPAGISTPVNPARGLFLRAKDSAICGHYHKTSEHTETTVNNKVVKCWSIGCLCDLHPKYMPINGWNNGFAIVKTEASGKFHVQNYSMIGGKVY